MPMPEPNIILTRAEPAITETSTHADILTITNAGRHYSAAPDTTAQGHRQIQARA